jgi:hypothetical protein
MTVDPDSADAQNAGNPQSWNLYTYALNNPLIFGDPSGLDCVYFNDAGNGVESIDHASNGNECGANGGRRSQADGRDETALPRRHGLRYIA